MKKIICIVFMLVSLNLVAQEGIKFQHGTWAQAKELAVKENKLIFVDFYTQWCGPCYNMAKNTFVLYSVGTLYNTNFVNMKIDAENGEGIELAKKYGVRSYPTYCFIDPKTEEIVHRSSSNQAPDTFIFTGESALNSKTTSVYLEKARAAGNKEAEFLLAFANYCGSCYRRDEALEAAQELVKINGYGLDNPKVWDLFVKFISGRENTLFTNLAANVDKYRTIYGAQKVDKKLFAECSYVPDSKLWATLPSFNGKEYLIKKEEANLALREKRYEQAAKIYDELMANPGNFKEDLCRSLTFTARSNQYGEHPAFWHDKCLEIARYVAYNNPNRDDVQIHHEYAKQLELKLQRLNTPLATPVNGAKEYSMRPADLKQKPSYKKK
ncbi:MAG: thioredoxin domain-containing protein [Bacteroidales bacterium]